MRDIQADVDTYLNNSSLDHIKEIWLHGIHNLTNEFNIEDLADLYAEEFKHKAKATAIRIERAKEKEIRDKSVIHKIDKQLIENLSDGHWHTICTSKSDETLIKNDSKWYLYSTESFFDVEIRKDGQEIELDLNLFCGHHNVVHAKRKIPIHEDMDIFVVNVKEALGLLIDDYNEIMLSLINKIGRPLVEIKRSLDEGDL